MDSSKTYILDKLRATECVNKFKDAKLNTVILFGSILTEDFTEHSDVDLAILSENNITLQLILSLEEDLKKLLGRDIDIINLKDENLDLNMKVTIYDDGLVIYDSDSLELYNRDYLETETLYRDNEAFRFFRERDVIFSE